MFKELAASDKKPPVPFARAVRASSIHCARINPPVFLVLRYRTLWEPPAIQAEPLCVERVRISFFRRVVLTKNV